MNPKLDVLIKVLMELRTASITSTEKTILDTMHKYDMLFLGSKFNCIYSHELCHALNNYFHVDIDNLELNQLIPTACKELKMDTEILVPITEINTNNISEDKICYKISLT